MRAVVQRVSSASVRVEGREVGAIGRGLLVFLGVGKEDGDDDAARLWSKLRRLRIFDDEAGKTNLSLQDVGGEVLIVSQFTLYASCKRGNRPSFTDAMPPDEARRLYELFVSLAREDVGDECMATGEFGAMMEVSLANDGPFTLVLDTERL